MPLLMGFKSRDKVAHFVQKDGKDVESVKVLSVSVHWILLGQQTTNKSFRIIFFHYSLLEKVTNL